MANKIVPQTLNSSGVYDKLITAISSGGTGAESESAAVKNLISGLTSTSPASNDLIPFQDVSSGGAGKTTLSALASALQSVRGYAKIQTGSYVGTGTYGADNPCRLTFNIYPHFVCVTGDDYFGRMLWVRGNSRGRVLTYTQRRAITINLIWSYNFIKYYCDEDSYDDCPRELMQLNESRKTYYWVAG